MSIATTLEDELLQSADSVLRSAVSIEDDRTAVLEAAASRAGGFDLLSYWKTFDLSPGLGARQALDIAERIVALLSSGPIPLPLGLSALARVRLAPTERRKSGAYYTDFRLAEYLAGISRDVLEPGGSVLDPACGSGMLLVAAVRAACGSDRCRTAAFIRDHVFAADLSSAALRGARLALAAMVSDIDAIAEMDSHWRCEDSLFANVAEWKAAVRGGFDLVIANPPWEKVKLSRHEFIRSQGGTRHYGDDYEDTSMPAYKRDVDTVTSYASRLLARYPLLRAGEPDLYRAFLELMVSLAKDGGRLSALIPAGMIRSQSTEELRRHLFTTTERMSVTVIENRARFFAIDSRFKFLALSAQLRSTPEESKLSQIRISHATGTHTGLRLHSHVPIRCSQLVSVRPDLTVPEVRRASEWQLYKRLYRAGGRWSDAPARWRPNIVRELDMTRDRAILSRARSVGRAPVVEGRMVHQYLFGAKKYVGGSGRRARWTGVPFGDSAIQPQFWCDIAVLPPKATERIGVERLGFCDITGQTNERSILAAMIPAGVVCGNKVPTIWFDDEQVDEAHRLRLLALFNSFVFDWAARRIITTTVNYFLLLSMPVPDAITGDTLAARRLQKAAQDLTRLSSTEAGYVDLKGVARIRAAIDVAVLKAYGLDVSDLQLILEDFPLLDRGQPPLPGEHRSTITTDFLLAHAAESCGQTGTAWHHRRDLALAAGAIPYIPSEYTLRRHLADDEAEDCHHDSR